MQNDAKNENGYQHNGLKAQQKFAEQFVLNILKENALPIALAKNPFQHGKKEPPPTS
jgi:hypothetical protein